MRRTQDRVQDTKDKVEVLKTSPEQRLVNGQTPITKDEEGFNGCTHDVN